MVRSLVLTSCLLFVTACGGSPVSPTTPAPSATTGAKADPPAAAPPTSSDPAPAPQPSPAPQPGPAPAPAPPPPAPSDPTPAPQPVHTLTATTQTSSLSLPSTFTIQIWSDVIVFNGMRLSIDGAPGGYVASGNGWRLNLNPTTATSWEWSLTGASGNAIGTAVTQ